MNSLQSIQQDCCVEVPTHPHFRSKLLAMTAQPKKQHSSSRGGSFALPAHIQSTKRSPWIHSSLSNKIAASRSPLTPTFALNSSQWPHNPKNNTRHREEAHLHYLLTFNRRSDLHNKALAYPTRLTRRDLPQPYIRTKLLAMTTKPKNNARHREETHLHYLLIFQSTKRSPWLSLSPFYKIAASRPHSPHIRNKLLAMTTKSKKNARHREEAHLHYLLTFNRRSDLHEYAYSYPTRLPRRGLPQPHFRTKLLAMTRLL